MGKWYASTEPLNEKYKAMNEIQALSKLPFLLNKIEGWMSDRKCHQQLQFLLLKGTIKF